MLSLTVFISDKVYYLLCFYNHTTGSVDYQVNTAGVYDVILNSGQTKACGEKLAPDDHRMAPFQTFYLPVVLALLMLCETIFQSLQC